MVKKASRANPINIYMLSLLVSASLMNLKFKAAMITLDCCICNAHGWT